MCVNNLRERCDGKMLLFFPREIETEYHEILIPLLWLCLGITLSWPGLDPLYCTALASSSIYRRQVVEQYARQISWDHLNCRFTIRYTQLSDT